jgi:hypothetical protein
MVPLLFVVKTGKIHVRVRYFALIQPGSNIFIGQFGPPIKKFSQPQPHLVSSRLVSSSLFVTYIGTCNCLEPQSRSPVVVLFLCGGPVPLQVRNNTQQNRNRNRRNNSSYIRHAPFSTVSRFVVSWLIVCSSCVVSCV